MLDSGFKRFFSGTQITSPAIRARIYAPAFWLRHDGLDAFTRLEAEYFANPKLKIPDEEMQEIAAELIPEIAETTKPKMPKKSKAKKNSSNKKKRRK